MGAINENHFHCTAIYIVVFVWLEPFNYYANVNLFIPAAMIVDRDTSIAEIHFGMATNSSGVSVSSISQRATFLLWKIFIDLIFLSASQINEIWLKLVMKTLYPIGFVNCAIFKIFSVMRVNNWFCERIHTHDIKWNEHIHTRAHTYMR